MYEVQEWWLWVSLPEWGGSGSQGQRQLSSHLYKASSQEQDWQWGTCINTQIFMRLFPWTFYKFTHDRNWHHPKAYKFLWLHFVTLMQNKCVWSFDLNKFQIIKKQHLLCRGNKFTAGYQDKRNVLGKANFHRPKYQPTGIQVSTYQYFLYFFSLYIGLFHVHMCCSWLECVGLCGMWGQSQSWHQPAHQQFLLLTVWVFPQKLQHHWFTLNTSICL